MSILIRCSKCNSYYGSKNKACTKCNNNDRIKQYYVQHAVSGKRVLEYAGTSLQIAKEIDAERKVQKRTGAIPQYAKISILTFDRYLDDYFLPHFSKKNKSYPQYIFNYFRNSFAGRNILDISPSDIEQAVHVGTAGTSSSNFNYHIAVITRIFNYAIEIDLINKSPVKIKKSREDNKRMRFLTVEEQELLLRACEKSNTTYLYEMAYISLYTGLRISEIRVLTPNSIRDNCVYVAPKDAKSKQGRAIPLNDKMQLFFKEQASFNYNHGIDNSWHTALKRANINNLRFHDLRHTFASRLVQAGVELYTVKELLGHASITMTQRYAHLAPGTLRQAVDRL